MRPFRLLPFLLLLAPTPTEKQDCGLVAGQRYWVVAGGGLVGDDLVVADATDCIIPEGVILSVHWNETPPRSRILVHPACSPTKDDEAILRRMTEQARAFLRQNGFDDANISVERTECATPKRVDVVVE